MEKIVSPTVAFTLAGARVSIPEATIADLWKERAGVGILQPPFGRHPRIGDVVDDGIFMGVVRNEDGIEYRIWDLGEANAAMEHEPALTWAKGRGGDLPTRREQSLLFANRAKGQFKEAWYWSKETHAGDASCAWVQGFGDGGQYGGHRSYGYRARAVRRSLTVVEFPLKKSRKMQKKLRLRQADYDKLKGRTGYKRPGSNTK